MFCNFEIITTDILIIGGGLAGLTSALETSKRKIKTTVVSRGSGASPGIIGFNAPISKDDSDDIFSEDILKSGCYINNLKLVNILVKESLEVVEMLEDMGLGFDKDGNEYNLLKPLSCSFPRLVHYKNYTGPVAIKLIKKELKGRGVNLLRNIIITHLLRDENKITGAFGFNIKTSQPIAFKANVVILATGGMGAIYPFSTYFFDVVGSGYAMAYDIGAELIDMEFIQFDPCSGVYPDTIRGKGVVTTILNEGGALYNRLGKRFMLNYGHKGESVHKDILSRHIFKEIKNGRGTKNGGIYFDMSSLPGKMIEEKYPYLFKRYLTAGYIRFHLYQNQDPYPLAFLLLLRIL